MMQGREWLIEDKFEAVQQEGFEAGLLGKPLNPYQGAEGQAWVEGFCRVFQRERPPSDE